MTSKLEAAQAELEALRGDLPRFLSLVEENEKAAADLKRSGAPLEKQAETRARVNASRELLEQHRADIEAAAAEVVRLEAETARAQVLEEMFKHATDAQTLRLRYDVIRAKTRDVLTKHLKDLDETHTGLLAAREGFHRGAAKLSPSIGTPISMTRGVSRDQRAAMQAEAEPIFSELEKRGANLSFVRTAYNPMREFGLDDHRSPHTIENVHPLDETLDAALAVYRDQGAQGG